MTTVHSTTTGSSFPSSFTEWSGMDTADRMLHDESSDASSSRASSYFFLQQFGSFATQEEEEEQEEERADQSTNFSSGQHTTTSATTDSLTQILKDYRPKAHPNDDEDDPSLADIMPEHSSSDDDDDDDDSSCNHPKDDLPVGENASDSSSTSDSSDESMSRIGIQPLGTYTFDTILEDVDVDDDDEDVQRDEKKMDDPSRKPSQDPYWNNNNNHPTNPNDETEEYSFFSGESEPPQTLWELLRLQTVLGSCTQPRSDSFDQEEQRANDLQLQDEDEIVEPSTPNKSFHKAKETNKPSNGWVFFEQMTQCGYPSSSVVDKNTTTTTTYNKKEEENPIPGTPASHQEPSNSNNVVDLDAYVHLAEEPRQDGGIQVALQKTKLKMGYLLGKFKRTTSANVRSVKLAASFTDESILNYEKMANEGGPKDDDGPSDEFKAPMTDQDGMLCQMSDQFASLGCYDDSCAPPSHDKSSPSRSIVETRHEHLDFDDFGVDANHTRNVHSSWAQFDTAFPDVKKKKALNTSYNSTETSTTAEDSECGSPRHPRAVSPREEGFELDASQLYPVFTDTYGGPGWHPKAAERCDSEYGKSSSYLLYQQRRKRRLSKGLYKMKRKFSISSKRSSSLVEI